MPGGGTRPWLDPREEQDPNRVAVWVGEGRDTLGEGQLSRWNVSPPETLLPSHPQAEFLLLWTDKLPFTLHWFPPSFQQQFPTPSLLPRPREKRRWKEPHPGISSIHAKLAELRLVYVQERADGSHYSSAAKGKRKHSPRAVYMLVKFAKTKHLFTSLF